MSNNFSIQFFSINDVWRYGNIGLDQLTGYLRSIGYDIKINYFGKKDSEKEFECAIDYKCSVFGFSVTFSNYEKCRYLLRKIKKETPKAVTIFGGGLVSRYYKEILSENKELDFVVLGDGEIPTGELLEAIKKGALDSFSNPSVASQKDLSNKRIQINTFVPTEPAYDYYLTDSRIRNSRKVHCIQTKNNICTGNCTFCTERHGKISYRDLNAIVSQIEKVHRDFGVNKIFFTDDNILDPNDDYAKNRMLDLCHELKARKLQLAYQCYMKANSLKNNPFDRNLLKEMRETGFVEVFIGAEAGNQADLDLYNKKTTVAENENAISMLREYDIFPILGFISFNPYSTLKSIRENFNFLIKNKCTYLFNYLYSFVIINKYTVMYDNIVRDNLLLSPESQYIDVKYSYVNKECIPILDYVRNNMIPVLNKFDYQLDWVTYSYLEHKIWYPNQIPEWEKILDEYKQEDIDVIEKYLSILFVENDLEKFRTCENDFWNHFKQRENVFAQMYRLLVSLHR